MYKLSYAFLGFHCCSRTLQFHSDDTHYIGTFWLCFHGRQWSNLRHLSQKLGHWKTYLHKLKSTYWPSMQKNAALSIILTKTHYRLIDCLIYHRIFEIWWSSERWFNGISNKSGALSENTFSTRNIRTCYFCRESLSWAAYCCWNYECLLWTGQSNGEMWP